MAEQESNRERALEFYSKALNFTDDGYAIASLYVKLGDLQFALQEYEKANASYMSVYEEGVPDIALNFYSRLQTIKGYAALKLYDTATYLSEEMLDDYRFAAYHPLVRLEYAGILLASGNPEDALSEYQFMDSTYARTENGANASYRLAEYYERQAGDYSRAASYYGKAGGVQGATVSAGGRKRENALLRIVSAYRELARNDSLVVLSDSARMYPENFLKLAPADTSSIAADSASVSPDSVTVLPPKPQYIATFKPLNADSMMTLRAKFAYDLGEIYYAELESPDSALAWFQKALDWKVDSTLAPRTLFILAELKQTHQKVSEDEIAAMYRTIVEDYPWSNYAREVSRILGLQVTEQTNDTFDGEYARAESLLWAGDYHSAIVQLKAIAIENPRSELAAKSQYALGWIYEYQLEKPDSALYYYRAIAEEHQSTPYATAVKNKLAGTNEEKQGSQIQPPQQPKQGETPKVIPERDAVPTEPDEGPIRRRLPQGRRAAPDSSKVRVD
jgi:tetratricopeptide (TPR) repeat protein